MVSSDHFYYEMGIGEGGRERGGVTSLVRMRQTDQSAHGKLSGAASGSNLIMDVWASVASWYFRPDGAGGPNLASATPTQALPLPPSICTVRSHDDELCPQIYGVRAELLLRSSAAFADRKIAAKLRETQQKLRALTIEPRLRSNIDYRSKSISNSIQNGGTSSSSYVDAI
ncbi:hypothetical protein LSTR_LSTR011350 [Laodelphax striatellus]|uniref:Uncharacterized protein n=1 Tax=Laodelphax striatellus TaxID=195883 RepID=A0A482XKT7_LAOST|nr:hypothetical protein LSTR_LSTR011350 [Laodelphax striatellus]